MWTDITDLRGRWLPIARGHRRAREHYGAVAVLILNRPLISRPQICQSSLWESQKTWKVGSFITMKLLLSWWSGSLIFVFAWIYRWSSRSVAKSACFSQVPPPPGLTPLYGLQQGVSLESVWFLSSPSWTGYSISPESVLNRVYNRVRVCPNYKLVIACTIDLIC